MSNNELDLGCEAGQTIVHASPAQPMEVDEPSVSSRAGLPAIHVNDHVSPTPRDGLTRASQWLEDLTSHGLTRGTLQIRTSALVESSSCQFVLRPLFMMAYRMTSFIREDTFMRFV